MRGGAPASATHHAAMHPGRETAAVRACRTGHPASSPIKAADGASTSTSSIPLNTRESHKDASSFMTSAAMGRSQAWQR